MATPQLGRTLEKTDIGIIFKTRIVGLQITFCLRHFFAGLKVEINFYGEIFLQRKVASVAGESVSGNKALAAKHFLAGDFGGNAHRGTR